jgi:hypothetical protein
MARKLLVLLFCSCAFPLAALAADNPLAGIFSAENMKKARIEGVDARPGPQPDSLVLKFPTSDTPGTLVLPVPEAARDWTAYRTLTFHFTSTSTIRWDLVIRNRQGQSAGFQLHPHQDLPVKAAIPLLFLTRDYMNSRQFKGCWASNWGGHIEVKEIESLAIRMQPNREVTLTVGPLTLEREDVPDEFYADKPVVDEFGQWIGAEWLGKIHDAEELRRAWKQEDAELAKPEAFGVCRYGGWAEGPKQRATGFFRTAQVDGRWWLVDPDGHPFFSHGVDCVRYRDGTQIAGRQKLFARLPPAGELQAEFYRANAAPRYGDADFVANWKAKQSERLRACGLNTVANWSDPAMFERPEVPFVVPLSIGYFGKNWQSFPDVYSEGFARATAEQADKQCARFRNEPFLIGYFIGNEPRWPGRGLIDLVLNDAAASETQAFARRFLAEKGDSAESRAALLETLAREYFGTICQAIRKADPNHLVLGIRFAGSAPEPVLKANDVFDVFSINIYRFEPPADQIARIATLLKKPVLIGEFHFGAAERGYAPSLVMVKDQHERAVAYQYYVEHAAAQEAIVGTHYFQMVDQPVAGRFDGENYNIGFVDQVDMPYREMTAASKATARRMYAVHAGKLPPVDRRAVVR